MRYSFQSDNKLFMVRRSSRPVGWSMRCWQVMDFISGGELFFHLSSKAIFSEQIARFYGEGHQQAEHSGE